MKKGDFLPARRKIEEIVRTTLDKKIEYVDIHGNLERANLFSDLVIFGRRGSGKTTLLIQSKNTAKEIFPIYIQSETYKEHTYPNLLLSILATIIKQSLDHFSFFQKILNRGLYQELKNKHQKIRQLIDEPDELNITEKNSNANSSSGEIGNKYAKVSAEESLRIEQSYTYKQQKIDYLTNNIDEFRDLFSKLVSFFAVKNIFIYFDDFYHLDFDSQPNIVDYIFRLSKDLKVSFKIATIKHRSNLYSRDNKKRIRGVQLNADHTSIDLDFSLESFDSTKEFLKEILKNIFITTECSFDNFYDLFVQDGFERVVWASGGVPRDFMILIMYIIDSLNFDNQSFKIDKKLINQAAKKLFDEKLQDLDSEYARESQIQQFYEDIFTFCVKYNKKTGFILRQPCEDIKIEDKIKNLMDHRLIHPVAKNMTITKGGGTFTAFILDIGAYQTFLTIRREQEKIKELDILRKDNYKKTELVEFRSLSIKQELTISNLEKAKKFIEDEKGKINKQKRNDDYAKMIQATLF